MRWFRQVRWWFTGRGRMSPQIVLVDIELLKRCARIIRGEEVGREARLDGTPFPAWGQADLEGRSLVWSGPFSFDLDVKYQLAVECLPGLYVTDPRTPFGLPVHEPDPLLTFIIKDSCTWATLWPAKEGQRP